MFLKFIIELVLKVLDRVRGQGEIRFENGACTEVREYFGSDFNLRRAIGQEMRILKSVQVRF